MNEDERSILASIGGVISPWERGTGASRRQRGFGASPANARAPSVSIIMLIQSICTTVTGASMPMNGPMNDTAVAHRFMINWNVMNFLMLLKIVLPNRTAFTMERRLESRITMSEAAEATSLPDPIANPTSAAQSDGASFTPSPVMPATSPEDFASSTSLSLSEGRARDTTFRRGMSSVTSPSLIARRTSPLMHTPPSVRIPHFPATAAAVCAPSPVIITTCIPAFCASRTEL